MSKKDMSREPQSLTEVTVEGRVKNGKVPSRKKSDFVYVNSAFVNSVSDVNNVHTNENMTPSRRTPSQRTPTAPAVPITGVYREQYWACSRWPYTQRVLAIAVGVLLGALIGLCISLAMRDKDDNTVIGPIFTRHPVPN